MKAPGILPVVTIGGYLGSGKTTMVNHLLRHANGRKLAILVNEFGELAIDEDLIEAEDDSLISIAGGCICCSFGSDLIGALKDLASMEPKPDCVLIESSGVAIPGAIVSTVALLEGFASDGIVVVVDAETVQRAASDEYIGDTILRQLADAEIVVINKLDLVDASKENELRGWLTEQAPSAILIPARHGQVSLDAIIGQVAMPQNGHHAHHTDKMYESMILKPSTQENAEELAGLLATGGFGVIRSKGYMEGKDGSTWLLQTVGHRWAASKAEPHERGIVCIGLRGELDTDKLLKRFCR